MFSFGAVLRASASVQAACKAACKLACAGSGEQCERKLQVRKHADKALEALVRTDPAQAEMVMERKFETFNQEWLHFCEHPDDPAFALPHGGGSGLLWDGGPHAGGERITGSMAALDATLGREDLSDGSDDDLDASYLRI